MRGFVLLGLLLAAVSASAQEEESEGVVPLNGVGRVTVQGGWRLTSNNTFFDSFYELPGLECSEGCLRDSPGGPFAAATFAYSVSDFIEVGIDLFYTQQQLRLTNAATHTNITYGALLGLRFQGLLEILTPQGVVPFIGLETGPSLAYSLVEGVGRRESIIQPWVGTVGATVRLSAHWAITAEYRLAFARGHSPYQNKPPPSGTGDSPYKNLASYNAGGNWFALGVTYLLAPDPVRTFSMP
ncbi:hypothetical protein [Cystobacter ferrugineus]|uniref:hypothetical protein n=1 Tax=Cystobacter ferrugineus TaxID=83449 RepID=UPI000A04F7A4|nr:hypothetical protein [Cystobacter ferrugineus]